MWTTDLKQVASVWSSLCHNMPLPLLLLPLLLSAAAASSIGGGQQQCRDGRFGASTGSPSDDSVLADVVGRLDAAGHTTRLNARPYLPFSCEEDNPILKREYGCFFQNPRSP